MKLQDAMYKVVIGMNYRDVQTDNWSSATVMGRDALVAANRVNLERGEYIAEISLVERLQSK